EDLGAGTEGAAGGGAGGPGEEEDRGPAQEGEGAGEVGPVGHAVRGLRQVARRAGEGHPGARGGREVKLIVFGASGLTGKLLVELAANAKHEVTAFVRTPAKLGPVTAGVKVIQGNGQDAKAVEDAMAGQEGA